jgi:hypothetical protein
MDPTKNKKYLEWLFKMRYTKNGDKYVMNKSFPSNIKAKVKEHLTWRENNSQRMTDDIKDINTFKDIKTFMDKMAEVALPSREDIKKQAKVVFEDDNWKVVIPLTFAASKLYGRNTKWCTTNASYFKQYTDAGKLYYIIDKVHNRKFGMSVTANGKINGNSLDNVHIFNNEDQTLRVSQLKQIYGKDISWITPIVSEYNHSISDRQIKATLEAAKRNLTSWRNSLKGYGLSNGEAKDLFKQLVDSI